MQNTSSRSFKPNCLSVENYEIYNKKYFWINLCNFLYCDTQNTSSSLFKPSFMNFFVENYEKKSNFASIHVHYFTYKQNTLCRQKLRNW